MQTSAGRRRFLAALAATGAAGLMGPTNSRAQGERLETTSVRLAKITGTCIAPQYLAEELLRLEGFTDVRYILFEAGLGQSKAI
ncbi:MAG TPA: twin-arginine translocation signal domain-containing protein, partial [Burkholderiales bacterium]|nr:twin-arginine translocation signal domain-containing protein [Burkholderiales bacterium]